jgi:hypothetical protein
MDNSVNCVKITCISCNSEISKKLTDSKYLEDLGNTYKIKYCHIHCIIYTNHFEQQSNYTSETIKCAKCSKKVGLYMVGSSLAFKSYLEHIILFKNAINV